MSIHEQKAKKISIRFKIVTSMAGLAIISLFLLVAVTEVRNSKTVTIVSDKIIEQGENIFFHLVEEQKHLAIEIARQYTTDKHLLSLFIANDRETLRYQLEPIFKQLNQYYGVTVFEYGDSKGTVFLRGHNPGQYGDNKSSSPSIQVALKGQESVGFIFGKSGLAIRGIVPIMNNEVIVGTIQVGFNINKVMLKNLSEMLGNIAFYENDTLVQTTSEQEQKNIGKKKEEVVFEKLSQGESRVVSNDKGKRLTFLPMRDPVTSSVQGMFRIDQDITPIVQRQKEDLSLIVFITVLAGLVIAVVANLLGVSISKPITRLTALLQNIAEGEGDLTKELEIMSSDEIGDMAKYFNLTFGKIKRLVSLVKKQSLTLQGVGINLASNMVETAAAINEITANIQSIKNQTINQSASVTETSATMEQISKGIDRLSRLIENQSDNVTESSSAVEEMIANIKRVTQTLVKNTENIKKLSSSSESGRSVLEKISVAIRAVSKNSEGLMEISKIIQDMASQTNLLSMNAAIEAAHAGESGKGFAVVADEIRKLAESSSSQTKTISSVLKKIMESMAEINKYSEDVLSKFTTIETEVAIVAEQEDHIRNAMEEQTEGSKQVLEAITVLNDITRKVQAGSMEMLTGSNQVSKEAINMNAITQEITGGMNEMASGADQITVAVNTVNELSFENKNSIDALINEVNKFKV